MRLTRFALLLLPFAVHATAAFSQAAPGAPPTFKFELATKPPLRGEMKLGTGPSGTPPEQWFLMNGELQVRNVNEASLTPVLPAAGKATGAAVVITGHP